MKLEMDEKLKHRLIGIAVILSIALIFTPAMIKKSSQRFDPKLTMNVKLPPRPHHPKVVEKSKEELFKTTRVAHVELEAVKESSQLTSMSKAEFIDKPGSADSDHNIQLAEISSIAAVEAESSHPSEPSIKNTAPGIQKKNLPQTAATHRSLSNTNVKTSNKPVTTAKNTAKKPMVSNKNSEFAIQLASFSVEKNATGLIRNLQKKGYSARITKVSHHNAYLYKVYVGHLKNRNEAEKLKHQLADNFKLKGFIVHTGVS